jgi:hypothetical protein
VLYLCNKDHQNELFTFSFITDCGASLCVITKPCERGDHSPRSAAKPEKKINNNNNNNSVI